MRRIPGVIVMALATYASSCASRPGRGESPQVAVIPPRSIVTSPPPAEPAVSPREIAEPPLPFNPEADLDRAGMLAEGAEGSGEIAFTFDDGPSPDTDPELLRILEARKIKAAFFLTGGRLAGQGPGIDANRAIARTIAAAGHTIGNHGLDHLAVNRSAIPWNAWQIEESARLIFESTAVPSRYFRPPYGKIATPAQEILAARREELVMWTLDAEDVRESSPEKLANKLVAQLLYAGQGIVLLHDTHLSSVRALPILLDWLAAHPRDPAKGTGYTVVDLPTYLAHAAARPYPYPNRLQLYRARERIHAAIRAKHA
ncbi:MAG: polysaccharide deacetylase family protein [Polyangiales bacterium]